MSVSHLEALVADESPQGWEVRVGDLVLREGEMTVAQAVDISRLAGGGWEAVDPTFSPLSTAAVVTALLVSGGMKEDEAAARVNAMAAVELLACIVRG